MPETKTDVLPGHPQLGQHRLHLREDRVVAAAWAPARVDCRSESPLFVRSIRVSGRCSSKWATSSATLNGLALHFRDGLGVDQVRRAEHLLQLPEVQLGHHHSFEPAEDRRPGRQAAGSGAADAHSRRSCPWRAGAVTASCRWRRACRPSRPPAGRPRGRRAPPWAGMSWRSPATFSARSAHHLLVVVGVVRHGARHAVLLEAADAVLEAGRARAHPLPRQRLGLALVGEEAFGSVRNFTSMGGSSLHVWNEPRLLPVRDVPVGEQEDRRHVLHRDARRLE